MQTKELVIDRVRRMEFYFDTVSQAVQKDAASVIRDKRVREMLQALITYYENGQWLADYEADERGELPSDMKRGVLSQDALYLLLNDIQQEKNRSATYKGGRKMVKGIHHISMKCQNEEEYQRVRHFYTGLLQMTIIKESENCTLLDTGAGIVEIFRNGKETLGKGVIRHVAFAVEDVEACVNAVIRAGYEVFLAPKEIQIGDDPAFPATIAFVRGPLGEEIEFFCQRW